ncbi:MAG: lasso peptide biosynthesis B2 protein, partial [Verrucomicrobia bacterium]|nr:lasso peptide biosynthesis B2 protein [Verrucomicrobiota bacterium]
MNRLRKFLALPFRYQRLLLSTSLLVLLIRLGLTLLPFRILRRLVDRWARPRDPATGENRLPRERLVWATVEASRHVPWTGNCLVRALAAQILLGRSGYPAELRIGVARDESTARLKAHAWLESEGAVVIGG